MITPELQYRIRAARRNIAVQAGPTPVHGEAIFAGGDYPRAWGEFVGQKVAVGWLRAAVRSARARCVRLDHVLLASGMPGVGKTTLAKLVAYTMGVGMLELSGAVSVDEARVALRGMNDGDVLFFDEIHLAVAGGKAKASWLLPLLTDGGLVTARGAEPMPKITVIGATTDHQSLPKTFLDRFMIQPVLEAYDGPEALLILTRLAERMGFGSSVLPMPDADSLSRLAVASNASPRAMRALLCAMRDTWYGTEAGFDVDLALTWSGVTHDGLNRLAQDFLCVLLAMCEGKASLATVAGLLNEPGPLQQTENLLSAKGYLRVENGGRALTEEGAVRTIDLLRERGMLGGEE